MLQFILNNGTVGSLRPHQKTSLQRYLTATKLIDDGEGYVGFFDAGELVVIPPAKKGGGPRKLQPGTTTRLGQVTDVGEVLRVPDNTDIAMPLTPARPVRPIR